MFDSMIESGFWPIVSINEDKNGALCPERKVDEAAKMVVCV